MIYFIILNYGNVRKNKINQKVKCHIIVMYITLRAHHGNLNALRVLQFVRPRAQN